MSKYYVEAEGFTLETESLLDADFIVSKLLKLSDNVEITISVKPEDAR